MKKKKKMKKKMKKKKKKKKKKTKSPQHRVVPIAAMLLKNKASRSDGK